MWKLKESMRNRVWKHFLQRGGNQSETVIYFDHPNQIRENQIINFKNFSFDEDELPILFCKYTDTCNLLLSNMKIHWKNNNQVSSIYLYDIKDVIFGSLNKKSKPHTLKVITNDDTIYLIDVEPGSTFFGIWNVLKMICNLSKK